MTDHEDLEDEIELRMIVREIATPHLKALMAGAPEGTHVGLVLVFKGSEEGGTTLVLSSDRRIIAANAKRWAEKTLAEPPEAMG